MTKPEYIDRRLHCPAPLYRAIETLARENHRSVNGEILRALEVYLQGRTLPVGEWCAACGAPVPTCACVPLEEDQ